MKTLTENIIDNLAKDRKSLIKKLADLPNIDGYEFLALKINGKPAFDKVVKGEDGIHRISDYKNTLGWICLDSFNYYVYDVDCKTLRAVQHKIDNALKYYKKDRSVFYGTAENHKNLNVTDTFKLFSNFK